MKKDFIKMHGLGNDFVIFDGRDGFLHLGEVQIRQISNRNLGVGCDQLIVMETSKTADIFMRIYNPDGSQAQACGNATRCVGRLVMDEKGVKSATIETVAGVLAVKDEGFEGITVDMGAVKTGWQDIPVTENIDTLNVPVTVKELSNPVAINIGNPHVVFFVENVDKVNLENIGPLVETHSLFPERINVEIVHIISRQHLRMRVWERGAGITQACGSGACAAVAAAVRRGLADRTAKVTLDGGDLSIVWREEDGHMLMTGPAAFSFCGEIEI